MSEARTLVEEAESLMSDSGFYTLQTSTNLTRMLERARSLSDGVDAEAHARASADLAQIYSRRSVGDPSRNREHALAFLREAEKYYTLSNEPDQLAMIRTNMAVVMLDREIGDPTENVDEAIRLCKEALRVRSKKKDALDWAFTMVNLARALCHYPYDPTNITAAEQRFSEAFAAYGRAADEFYALGKRSQGSLCKNNRAVAAKEIVQLRIDVRKRQAAKSFLGQGLQVAPGFLNVADIDEQENITRAVRFAELIQLNPGIIDVVTPPRWVHDICDITVDSRDKKTLARARSDARQAIDRSSNDPIAAAVASRTLADIMLLESEDDSERIVLLTSSLERLQEFDMPRDLLTISNRLGEAHALRGEWQQAAQAYSTSVDALERLYTQRGTDEGRALELGRQSKLSEWAAYCLAKSGDLQKAVLALENGRTRALGYRLRRDESQLAALSALDDALPSRITRLQQELRARSRDSIGDTGSDYRELADQLDKAVDEVRARPGLETFMRATTISEIIEAAEPLCPLIYLVATAVGSIALMVDPGAQDESQSVVLVTESEVSSADITRLLIRYQEAGPYGLLFPRDEDLNSILFDLQETLGRAFGAPLKRKLDELGAQSVAIVAAGILSSFPFAAIGIQDLTTGQPTLDNYLGDHFDVLSAPSASVLRSCRRRAADLERSRYRMLAVGDPTASRRLEGAAAEVDAIVQLTLWQESVVLMGAAADRDAVIAGASRTDFLHLACHGVSNLADPAKSALLLADGELSVDEITRVAAINCRLVVASACESGRIGIWQVANEYIGLPGAFLSAGAACVVASLWPVDDQATSLLMTRFYEELASVTASGVVPPGAPATALRRAQVWLRKLTEVQLEWYLSQHVPLRSRQEKPSGRGSPNWRVFGRRHNDIRPFKDPRYWAPFVVVGV